MPIRTKYSAGSACWFAYTAPDVHIAGRFYERLFGWHLRVDPGMSPVALARTARGGVVASLTPSHAGPAGWTVCLSAPDLAASIRRLPGVGARALTPSIKMDGVGSLAVVEDRCGNVFGLFSGTAGRGIVAVNEPGAVVGVQLRHGCADDLLLECRGICGAVSPTGVDEVRLDVDGSPGMTSVLDVRRCTGYVPVFGSDDLEATIRRAVTLGAQVEAEDAGALMRDPAGAVLGLRNCVG